MATKNRKFLKLPRISLRSFFVVVFIFILAFLFVSNQVSQQDELVDWVNKNEGKLTYQENQLGWLAGELGEYPTWFNYCHRVSEIRLTGLKEEDIRILSNGNSLTYLSIATSEVDDLSALEGLSNLKTLSLWHTSVHDFSALAKLKHLEILELSMTNISDLSPLSQLTDLTKLRLNFTEVKDLSPLKSLRNLQELYLDGTRVEKLTALEDLLNLRCLRLEYTKVSKAEFEYLQEKLPYCHIVYHLKEN